MKIPITTLTLFSLLFLNSTVIGNNNDQELFKETKSVAKGEATFVNVQLAFLGGKIALSGGSKELMSGKFEYSDMKWQPEIQYHVKNKIGSLKISMPAADKEININDDDVNSWDVQLNNDILMDLTIKLGGGEGNYELSRLKLNSLEIQLGGGKLDIDLRNSSIPRLNFKAVAGEATVDLSGKWDNNLDADFVCGFGELNLKLPAQVGVNVKATGILGNIDAPGFSKDGSTYTNDRYRKTRNTLYIDIFGGIGNVNLELID